jgi:hypothetical protein
VAVEKLASEKSEKMRTRQKKGVFQQPQGLSPHISECDEAEWVIGGNGSFIGIFIFSHRITFLKRRFRKEYQSNFERF